MIKKIIKYIYYFILFMFVLFGFKSCVKANVYYGNGSTTGSSQLSYSAYTTINSGQKNFFFGTSRVYQDMTLVPTWFKVTFCVDGTVSNFSGDSSIDNVSFYLTDIKCNYPNSSYDKGRLMYLYGQIRLASACSVNGTNCTNTGKVIFTNDKQSSWVILNEEYKVDGINIDFGGNQAGSNSSTIISQNDTIISQNAQGNAKLVDIDNYVRDGHVSGSGIHSQTQQLQQLLPTNGTITNLLQLPITLLLAFSSNLGGACYYYNLGALFGTNLIMPCVNLSELLGSTLWSTIDIIISGFMIYAIGKKMIRIFNDLTSLKDNQIDDLYGGGV